MVALGEIGLDYHHPPEDPAAFAASRERQAALFRAQLDLAVELGLNAVIHQPRFVGGHDCHPARVHRPRARGLHCFGGTTAQAEEVLALGHLVSFTGIVTFKNARQVQETARALGAAQFMVETDCPYLAPAPDRGKRCEPAHTRRIADFIAQLRGIAVEELAAQDHGDGARVFRFSAGRVGVAAIIVAAVYDRR